MTDSHSSPSDRLTLEGIMVAGRPGEVRVLIDHAVIDLDEADVTSVVELPMPPDLIEAVAQPVRIELRRGARLLGIGAADAYDDVIWRRAHLFATRTRRSEQPWSVSDAYTQLETEFFASYGIVVGGGKGTP